MEITQIDINKIRPDKNQPRKEFEPESMSRLKESIKDNGMENPIIVRTNGKGFIIIDGERRWRSSKGTLSELPCIVVDEIGDYLDILDKQLRSGCMIQQLNVDELDKAMYKYFKGIKVFKDKPKDQTSLVFSRWMSKKYKHNIKVSNETLQLYIGDRIGKSVIRVQKAIDRFEFKRDNKDFIDDIEKKYPKQKKKFGKVNSTIAMTNTIKDKEVRKKAIDNIMAEKNKGYIDTPKTKTKIKKLSYVDNLKDADAILDGFEFDPMKQPAVVFEDFIVSCLRLKSEFDDYKFAEVSEHITPKQKKQVGKIFKDILTALKNNKLLGEK